MAYRILISLTVLFSSGIFIANAQAPCSVKVDYLIESRSNGSKAINLKSAEIPKAVKVQLYDLNIGKVVNEREVTIGTSFKSIFVDVKSSLYIVYIWLPGCTKPVVIGGEKHGILIEN
jgi:hypothetical protein